MRPIQPSSFDYQLPQLIQSGPNSQAAGANAWGDSSSYSLQVPDNTFVGGNPRGSGAVDLQTSRTAANQVASGANSFLAGSNSIASGSGSIAVGTGCTASGIASTAFGTSTASNSYALATGNSVASGAYSVGLQYANAVRNGVFNFNGVPFASRGEAQTGIIVLGGTTTTTTTVALTSDLAAGSSTNQLSVPTAGQAIYGSGEIVARQTATNQVSAWTITLAIYNNGGTPATVPISNVANVFGGISLLSASPTIAVSGNNLVIFSGAKSSATIRWVATVRFTEIIYA